MDYCSSLAPVISILHSVVTLIQWGIPIVLIIYGILDLGKAVIASKEDEMKKATGTLIKRFIYAVAVFLVVFLVQLVMDVVSNSGANDGTQDWKDCWSAKTNSNNGGVEG